MLLSILKHLTKTILKQVTDGFSRLAESIGLLNDKIIIVENELYKRTIDIDQLSDEIKYLNGLTQEQIDVMIDDIAKEVEYK